jgi:hypothetical protein
MKSTLIIATLIISTALLTGQNTAEKKMIRIKKVENVNGVEKIIDTTYAIDGPVTLETLTELNDLENKKDCKGKKMVIITDEIHGDNLTVVESESEMDAQMQKALKEAGVDGKNLGIDKMVVVNVEAENDGKTGEKKTTKVVIVKTAKITDPSEEDKKMLGKQTGLADNKLALDKMKFYPNPNTGKFTLDFNLTEKGTTSVNIFNLEGKSVYTEELKDFSGNYNKEIDISTNPKGVYFVKISQGAHAQLKKIVLD